MPNVKKQKQTNKQNKIPNKKTQSFDSNKNKIKQNN